MVEGILDYLNILAEHTALKEIMICFSCVFALTPPSKNRKSILFFILKVVALTLCAYFFNGLFNGIRYQIGLDKASLFVFEFCYVVVSFLVYGLVFSKNPWRSRITNTLIIMAITLDVINLSYSLGHYVDNVYAWTTYPLLIFVYSFLVVVSIAMGIRRISDYDSVIPLGLFYYNILISSVVVIVTAVTQFLDTTYAANATDPSFDHFPYSIIIFLVLYILGFCGYFTTYSVCKEKMKNYELSAKSMMMNASNLQLDLTRSSMDELRKIRHDMKNNFAYMSLLAQEKKYDELTKYISTFSSSKLKPDFYIDCGNSDVSSILTLESTKANLDGLSLQCNLVIPPKLPIEAFDLCAILTNLIDNAIESNVRYGIKDPITVVMNLRNDYLYICVSNSLPKGTDNKKLLTLSSTKPNKSEHGYGTKIVQIQAKKYNGYYLFDVDGDRFVTEVMLDMVGSKENKTND